MCFPYSFLAFVTVYPSGFAFYGNAGAEGRKGCPPPRRRGRSVLIQRAVDDFVAHDGRRNPDILDGFLGNRQRIGFEDHEVGQLAGFKAALDAFFASLIGGPRGHAAQRVHDGNGIFLAKDLPAAGDAVDRRPHGEQGINGGYERVVVVAERDTALQGAAERADAFGAVLAEEHFIMAVAPEIGVDHKERGHHAKPLDAVELILAHGLAVDV